ncbi:glycosyltransferase family 39 protein [Asticcacaulis sp. ZE23SCel15]|uniref:glycosyltransferase family 39 protein n=1 Tax=Asticcacaulis sp. ZE23SCel15 TaxID=3059027 RepID=UPI00265EB2F6|nr:glycosyltransferase family 39 protein [Asticcacaulis sp. ZE23SCel15]WKL57930.1 glycosyltransferase family 39 protein [Asticcacaulis sp. ZE23SCel15]
MDCKDINNERFWLGLCALAGTVFLVMFVVNARRGGLWTDELFTVWATDPSINPWQLQFDRLRYETNPPLHFWLLYGLRQVVPEARVAGLILNFTVVVATVAAIVMTMRRDGRAWLGYALAILFLLNTATLIYVQEVRAYMLALGLCAVLAVLVMRFIAQGRGRVALLAVLGAVTGLSHVYGALFAGALAAALVIEGLVFRRTEVWRAGLILGVACSVPFLIWFVGVSHQEGGTLRNIGWISFAPEHIKSTIDGIVRVFVGPVWVVIIWVMALILALSSPVFRRSGLMVAVVAVIFMIGPFAISAKVPILHYRYFAVGFPALMLLLAMAVCEVWRAEPSRLRKGAAAILVLIPVVMSLPVSWVELTAKPVWRGAEVVRTNAQACPSQTIRGLIYPDAKVQPIFPFTYEYLLRGTGLKVTGSDQVADVSDINCRIVAWVEHSGFISETTDEALLLERLNLTNRERVPLTIQRHLNGVVILKR